MWLCNSEMYSMKIGCISFFDSQLLNKIYGVYDLINIKLRISVVYQVLWVSKNLFSNGFANLGFVHHGTACVSAAVRCMIHTELFHQRLEAFFVIIVVLKLLAIGTVNEIFAVGIFKPGFVEWIYFFCNGNFANSILGLARHYIKVPFERRVRT